MEPQNYKYPPIIEAVIGITFESTIEDEKISDIQEKFVVNYPQYQALENVNFKVELEVGADKKKKANTVLAEQRGHRRSGHDMTEMLILMPQSFIVSQLAPYPGWDVFFGRFVRDWKFWKRRMKYQQVKRIGVRYINRIDIPVTGPVLEFEQFLNVYPKVPDMLGPLIAYGVQGTFMLSDIGCQLNLNSAAVPSPILGHASFMIDMDIWIEANVPQKDADIYKLLGKIRERKNAIFEASVSDRARGLFGNDK